MSDESDAIVPTVDGTLYEASKTYVIICHGCEEDITRPLSGEDVTTAEEVRQYIAEHHATWHPRRKGKLRINNGAGWYWSSFPRTK